MLKVSNLKITQGSFSLDLINLEIQDGEYCVLMGSSGCGKTTIMESVCGLRDIESGKIEVDGQDITDLVPGLRKVAYVPQDGALFPTMKVGQQIAFPALMQKRDPSEINELVKSISESLNIAHLLERSPEFLSGGEKQRVALARALAMEPKALCFDEPLSALDEELHEEICTLLKNTVKERNLPCLHITHSRKEAVAMADKAYKLYNGNIEKIDLESERRV